MSDILFQPLGSPTPAGEGLDHLADIDPRLTRTHYFDGRLLTAEDLTRDQIYLDQRLRELGRVLGSGIMAGLELSFDRFTGLLTLQPGQALTPLGRVLELGTPLVVNLGDRALISTLNEGKYRSLNRALYAVVLRYALARPRLWLVSFHGVEQGETRFSPLEITLRCGGREFRPVDAIPLTPGFGAQRLGQRETQAALYVFDGALDVNQPLTITFQTVQSAAWEVILRRVERERSLIRSRAARGREESDTRN